jgi:hypothetical protein
MVVYRIDWLDDEGRIARSEDVVSPDDREVLRAGARLIGGHRAVEVWERTRVVGQLTAEECRLIQAGIARRTRGGTHIKAT